MVDLNATIVIAHSEKEQTAGAHKRSFGFHPLQPTEAIGLATWEAWRWLGHPGLLEGASADLVVYREDPRKDLRTLADPHRAVLRGSVVPTSGAPG